MITEHSRSLFHNGVRCRNESATPNFSTVVQIFLVFYVLRSGPFTEVSLMLQTVEEEVGVRAAQAAAAVCVALSSAVVEKGLVYFYSNEPIHNGDGSSSL